MRKRNRRFNLWLNDKEFGYLAGQAKISGLKKEPYIRRLIMNREIRPRPPDEYIKILHEISAIADNVDHLAAEAERQGVVKTDELRQIREELNKLWQEVKKS